MSSILLFLLVTVGALISSLTGLGGGTLILAGMLLVFPPELAIPLHSFTQLTANSVRVGIFFKAINWKVVGAYGALMIPAAWMGAKLFHLIDPNWLKIIVGLFIIFSLIPFSFTPKGEPRLRTFVGLGAFSGFLGVFVGAVGPMVMPFFNRLKIERQGMLSTKSAGQALLQLSKIIAFWGAADINFMALKENILILILASLLGVAISIPISKRISDEKFNFLINMMLGMIAVKILYEGVTSLINQS